MCGPEKLWLIGVRLRDCDERVVVVVGAAGGAERVCAVSAWILLLAGEDPCYGIVVDYRLEVAVGDAVGAAS